MMKREGIIKVKQQDQLDVLCEKVKKHFKMNQETSVEEIANKIDELVCKMIELEMTVSSFNTQINHLSSENGEKIELFNDSNKLNRRLKEAEELKSVKNLEKECQRRREGCCKWVY
jgi:hypothetical protein